jgi:hypothetical protein
MLARELLAAKWDEAGLLLQRRLWRPLRSAMDIFHLLPLVVVLILFVLFATDGQFRELYISYLEGVNGDPIWWVQVIAAFVAIGLISAVLYEAHYALSTMRINVIYSSYSNPDANSRLRSMQAAAAFILAFLPWFGFAIGLLNARNFVAARYCQLRDVANVNSGELQQMQFLPIPDGWTIAGALILLGLATAYFSSAGEYNRMAQRAVACLALPVAATLFLLFRGLPADGQWLSHWIEGPLIVAVATAIYFWIYHRLHRQRSGLVYSGISSGTGTSMRRRRRRWLALWAFLPWFFLALYYLVFHRVADTSAIDNCPGSASAHAAAISQWAIFPVAMCCTMAMGLLVGHLLGRFSTFRWRRPVILLTVGALAAAIESVSWLGGVDTTVALYRSIGPLGTVALALLFLISTFALLAALSQRSGFPALTLIVLGLVVSAMFPNYAGWSVLAIGIACAVFAAMALLSRRFATAAVLALLPVLVFINWHKMNVTLVEQNPEGTDLTKVKVEFACWLEQRGIAVPAGNACPGGTRPSSTPAPKAPANKKYPVFIVAAEGGGIYAASAISTFLSRLQQAAPHFDQHVFAISGVSGGSIGAAIFQAFDQAAHAQALTAGNYACPTPVATGQGQKASLEQKTGGVMKDDHFSPVVGSIFPEILGAPVTRADALVASFEYSASVQDAVAARALCAPFIQHWSSASPAPALVLNSTWVETGFRVAFAPFQLHDTDESLYSFLDPDMPDERGRQLMEAAAVSARFPLIMPPFSVTMAGTSDSSATGRSNSVADNAPATKRWNFVDGAYSDNSGANTALDIYRALQKVAPDNVDLRIILITSSDPQPDLKGRSINGTVFRDTIAPIDALMKVREDLGNDAVARACSYIYENGNDANTAEKRPARSGSRKSKESNETCIDHAGKSDAALQIVEIQDQTYGLPLGWKISATSFAVVSWMLGTPGKCPDPQKQTADLPSSDDQEVAPHNENENSQLTDEILQRNSCVMRLVVELVGGSAAGSKAAAQ